jgi:hypothetical protein
VRRAERLAAEKEGADAFALGLPADANPYPRPLHRKHDAWAIGWDCERFRQIETRRSRKAEVTR